jgi:tRNA(Ile)-lysidine synthase
MQHDLLNRFRNNIKELDLFSPKDKLILAVSGGVDSVVLCELCKQAGYEFYDRALQFSIKRGGE